MTEEHIKEKAKDFVSKRAGGTSKEMDYYADILAEFANEVTKELQNENAELKSKLTEKVTLESLDVVSARITDLEKENVELNKNLSKAEADYDKMFWQKNEIISNLEKENAELEKKLTEKVTLESLDVVSARINELENNLTKAKELIEDMYDAIPSSHSDYYKDVMERAEQFLKDSEVEK